MEEKNIKKQKKRLKFWGMATIFLIVVTVIFLFYPVLNVRSQGEIIKREGVLKGKWQCGEIIPIGEVINESENFFNDIFKILKDISFSVYFSEEKTKEELEVLNEHSEEICNFRECHPQVADSSPTLNLNFNYIFGFVPLLLIHVPECQPQEATGSPCPDLDQFIKDIKGYRSSIKASYDALKNLFSEKVKLVTNDIKESSGTPTYITRAEFIRKKLKFARMWLTPDYKIFGKNSCVIGKAEYSTLDEHPENNRFPMNCHQALNMNQYWPRPWSENCTDKCADLSTPQSYENCIECLKKSPSLPLEMEKFSPLAKINYKIYSKCGEVCEKNLSEKECLTCLCCRDPNSDGTCDSDQKMTEQECRDWICGGTVDNWVCCYQQPLELQKQQ